MALGWVRRLVRRPAQKGPGGVAIASLVMCLVAAASCDRAIEGDEKGECSDGVDNDQDGSTDCNDETCSAARACEGFPVRVNVAGTGGAAVWRAGVYVKEGPHRTQGVQWEDVPARSRDLIAAEVLAPWECALSAEDYDTVSRRPFRTLLCIVRGTRHAVGVSLLFEKPANARSANVTHETLMLASGDQLVELQILGILGSEHL